MTILSYAECSARERLALLLDAGSFHEWLPPQERVMSPHLAQLGVRLTRLTTDQASYIGVPVEGPYKPDHYRY